MNFELKPGTLLVDFGNGVTYNFNALSCECCRELSADETAPLKYHIDTDAEFSATMIGIDLAPTYDYSIMQFPNEKFVIEHQMPIMIQARWHKNKRINKKWQKRYGMKSDTVRIRANATIGEYHADDGSFDFEADELEYLWRPDQKRKGLKIER